MTSGPRDLPASVRQRLLNHARAEAIDFNYVLRRYANERFLYRLSRSAWQEQLALKGANAFLVWSRHGFRQSRDVDLLARGLPIEDVERCILEVLAVDVEADGVVFRSDTIRVEDIREETEYDGSRVSLEATLAGARIPVQIDIAFGDPVVSAPALEPFPTLLADSPAPTVLAYPRETVIAEKYEAIVRLGEANTRLRTSSTCGCCRTSSSSRGRSRTRSRRRSQAAVRRSRKDPRSVCPSRSWMASVPNAGAPSSTGRTSKPRGFLR